MPDAKSMFSQMAKKQKWSPDSHINQRMSVSPSLHLRLCAKLSYSPSLFLKEVFNPLLPSTKTLKCLNMHSCIISF